MEVFFLREAVAAVWQQANPQAVAQVDPAGPLGVFFSATDAAHKFSIGGTVNVDDAPLASGRLTGGGKDIISRMVGSAAWTAPVVSAATANSIQR